MLGLRAIKDSSEHTGSYYAASRQPTTDYSFLSEAATCDVVVVGGGFSGVNTAVELTERGYEVILIEANRIGWGASGRNGGQIIGGIGHTPERFKKLIGEQGIKTIYQMGIEARDVIKERIETYGIDCDLKWGYCDVALKPRHMKEFATWRDWERTIGNPHPYTLLDASELKSFVNSDRYLGGLHNTANGHIHPLNLCVGEAAAAVSCGARVFEQTRAIEIIPGDNPVVKTEHGSITAKQIVLAGNAYMGKLIPKLSLRVLPSASSVIATEPLSEALATKLLPGDVAVCDPRTALDYFRLSADRRMLFGGLSNYTGMEPKNLVPVMRKKMRNVFAELADIKIEYAWSGWIGIGINRMPQLGKLAPNIRYIQAYSGHGVAPTHMMAKITAESIAGETNRFDVMAAIPHMAFPGGRVLGRPLLAAGMAYYKFLDLF
jgi:glycine/D-amino acid oxidase-like deaminating enzyme